MTLLSDPPFSARRSRLIAVARERVAAGETLRGCFVGFADPRIIDVWAAAGLDLVALDLEHSSLGLETTDAVIAAAVHAGLVPLVRVASDDRQLALRALDSGAAGVMVADVRTPEQVRSWRRTIDYPPVGVRGVSSTRAMDWGLPRLTTAGVEPALLVPMVETLDAANTAADLLAVPGADWWHIGRADLTADLTAHDGAPDIAAVVDGIHAAAAASGVRLGENSAVTDLSAAARATVVMVTDRQLAYAAGRSFADAER